MGEICVMNIKNTVSVFLAFNMVLLAGCQNGSHSAQPMSSQSSSGTASLPADLTGLENNVETIVKTLNGPAVQGKGSASSSFGQSSSNGQESGSSSSGQSGSSEQESGSPPSGQSGSSKPSGSSGTSQQDTIEKIVPIVESMHYQWNNLMSEAIKKGANNALVNDFDNSLNNLSNTVKTKNKVKIMMAANRVYAYIPELYSLFQAQSSPQIKRMEYYTRSVILNAETANWKQADSDLSSLKSVWLPYKNSLNKNQQESANKLDLSIAELEKVVKERNSSLVDIKGKVELSNTQELEKTAESAGQSSNTQSGKGTSNAD